MDADTQRRRTRSSSALPCNTVKGPLLLSLSELGRGGDDKLRTMIARFDERLASLSSHRNSFLPINRLPNELFVEIFLYALPTICKGCTRQRTSLMLVCGRWKAVIMSAPALWSSLYISSYNPRSGTPLHWHKQLRRSGGHRLQLDVYFPQDMQYLAELTPHFDRLHALTIAASYPVLQDFLDEFGKRKRPTLQRLSLTAAYLEPDQYTTVAISSLATVNICSELRSIEVHDVDIDWKVLHDLTSLTMTRHPLCSDDSKLDPHTIFEILSRSPALEHLHLSQCTSMRRPPINAIDLPLHLPYLRRTYLCDSAESAGICGLIMRYVVACPVESIYLSSTTIRSWFDVLSLMYAILHHRQAAPPPRTLQLYAESNLTNFTFVADTPSLQAFIDTGSDAVHTSQTLSLATYPATESDRLAVLSRVLCPQFANNVELLDLRLSSSSSLTEDICYCLLHRLPALRNLLLPNEQMSTFCVRLLCQSAEMRCDGLEEEALVVPPLDAILWDRRIFKFHHDMGLWKTPFEFTVTHNILSLLLAYKRLKMPLARLVFVMENGARGLLRPPILLEMARHVTDHVFMRDDAGDHVYPGSASKAQPPQ
ncbi:hypothetical protein BD626DRAFT_101821 [Schizophyllum amplum]|uniref:F-box domain-containing protein n=1 Tax=Schizophyllum amplum TaxID=97359 RepID=A0A550CRS6_9AGAR|nr:hypothetical protein BD626DRAFT_101821 [Auriculariopsis ampla]